MTLGELFAGIANAIRSKDGTTANIPALTFPERIRAISGDGGGGKITVSVREGVNRDDTIGGKDAEVVRVPSGFSLPTVSVSVEKYYTHFLYNGVRLPRIPEDATDTYWIIIGNPETGKATLFGSKTVWYFYPTEAYPSCIDSNDSTNCRRYVVDDTGTSWLLNNSDSNNYMYVNTTANDRLIWSSHDVPYGSATATDIYFAATDPVPTD